MNIADKIVKLRKENKMSQEDLASKLNISRQSISKWESNISIPDAYNIVELSKLFKVTTDYLLYDDYESDDDIPKIKEAKQDIKINKDKELKSVLTETIFWAIASTAFIIAAYSNVITGPLIHLNAILCVVLSLINAYHYINLKHNTIGKYHSLKLSLMLIFASITMIITYAMNRFTYNEILFFTICSIVLSLLFIHIIIVFSNHH